MEQIRKAVELARAGGVAPAELDDRSGANRPRPRSGSSDSRLERRNDVRPEPRGDLRAGSGVGASYRTPREVMLNGAHLEANRIVAHDIADVRSKSFDMLRTQVLRTMDLQHWQFLAVTSPTAGCGKTVTAVNLALSIARQPERSVLLVDMDMQKPHVGHSLGIKCDRGLLSVIGEGASLVDSSLEARIGSHRLTVLPIEHPTSNSSEWMASPGHEHLVAGYQTRVSVSDRDPRHAPNVVERRSHLHSSADRLRSVGGGGRHHRPHPKSRSATGICNRLTWSGLYSTKCQGRPAGIITDSQSAHDPEKPQVDPGQVQR